MPRPEAQWAPEHGTKEKVAADLSEFLVTKAELLDEYFAIRIDADGLLLGMPVLLDKYLPDFGRLPMFLLKLATEVFFFLVYLFLKEKKKKEKGGGGGGGEGLNRIV